jgi:5-methylcytosine-specific restriction endonuclease McrA
MPEEQKEPGRRAYQTAWARNKYANLSPAEKKIISKAVSERVANQSPEERSHRNALWRQAWARRKRKADLKKMSPQERKREDDRWAKLAPEQQEVESRQAFEDHFGPTPEESESNAIDDLGTDTPARAKSEVWSYPRNPKVRDAVLRRAKGKCEFCGELGFMKSDGTRYLESHHVIFLASDGADRLTNVIALCPSDHREAHFGKKSKEIEKAMIQKLEAMNR